MDHHTESRHTPGAAGSTFQRQTHRGGCSPSSLPLMASAPAPQAISDRSEIHRSCKSLEAVVNLLNEYSGTVRTILSLQKKLSKALRDAAALKATADIPGVYVLAVLAVHT